MIEKKNHMFKSLLALWIGWVFASWMHIFAGACMMYAYVKLAHVTTIMLVGNFSIPLSVFVHATKLFIRLQCTNIFAS